MVFFSSPAIGRAMLCFAMASSLPSLLLAAPAPAVLPDTMEQRLQACIACHAAKERNDAFFPRISGKPAGYLYNQLLNFRDGRRQYPLMTYMVDHLPDAYLREIADYFSAQHPAPPPAQASGASAGTLERGRRLAMLGDPAKKVPACIACHGQQLTGVAPAIPGLLGLPRDYINAQFGAWKNQVRHADAPDCMAEIAARLSEADIAAVSSWLGSQATSADMRPANAIALPLPMHCGSVPPSAGAAIQ
ncbi:c-type cytochrome [Janthinobacterium agaricidamnosum]|uniref:Cytochrome c family protein n=1 Tax=Janthinobacterium agaricidamnosum NBRC 102515 = DSM 9628 TaxID=1349767 RepID=W0V3Y3_9BURK|nr:cytochrome c [Janthinobacterium agaricidamnosum]CDG82058.1 cytochrome c family protein [Janthinobacterium agaricidamnosum NBRC 102515 = DSM 9628]